MMKQTFPQSPLRVTPVPTEPAQSKPEPIAKEPEHGLVNPDFAARHRPVATPNRAQWFENDLDDSEKQALIDKLVASAKSLLSEPRVTVNSVARLMGMEHAKVKAALAMGDSLKQFLADRDDSRNALHIKKAFARMSPDEQKSMLAQLQMMQA